MTARARGDDPLPPENKKGEIREAGENRLKGPPEFQQEKRLDKVKGVEGINGEREQTREKKADIVEKMVSRDFPVRGEKRLDQAKDFHYLDEEKFSAELRKRDPFAKEEDIRRTEGFYDPRDHQAFVKEKGDTLATGLHEKLHQKSANELPSRFREGITEYLSRKEAGPWGELKKYDEKGREIPRIATDYEKEVEIIKKLEATVGNQPIHAAFFEGKTEVLKDHMDKILGEGSFKKLSEALERKDYRAASKILEKM